VSLDVDPNSRTINQGTTTFCTGVATFANGATKNYTQRVEWTSSDPAIASISSLDRERGKVTGNGPGTVILRARDLVSGVDSNDSGQNGSITVLGPLESIELTPIDATDTVGEDQFFTANGHFAGRTEKNLTQDLLYSSTDLAVAQPTNESGRKSRVLAIAPGVAIIRATDPISGIVSNDATYHVVGP
jgi:hypothetical protein